MLDDILQSFGLTEKEAKIYLANLELGPATVTDIAHHASIQRTTAYTVIQKLIEQKLLKEDLSAKIQRYTVEDPEKIFLESQERMMALKTVMPTLKAMHRGTQFKPTVRYYKGLEGIRSFYEGILKEKDLKSYCIVSSESSWMKMDPPYFKKFLHRRAQKRIYTRLILEDSPQAREHQRRQKEYYGEVKILPQNAESLFESGVYIFSQKVIFIAQKQEFIAVEIESRDIQRTLQFMFDFMWAKL